MPRIRVAGLVASASALALTLTGCSVVTAFVPHVDTAIYATAKDLKAAPTASFGSPRFLPDDAALIRVDYDTQTGAVILTYGSKAHFAPGTCQQQAPLPKPAIQDSWWPVDGLPAGGFHCAGGWTAFVMGDQVFAALPGA